MQGSWVCRFLQGRGSDALRSLQILQCNVNTDFCNSQTEAALVCAGVALVHMPGLEQTARSLDVDRHAHKDVQPESFVP
jgi:hypothetical protein